MEHYAGIDVSLGTEQRMRGGRDRADRPGGQGGERARGTGRGSSGRLGVAVTRIGLEAGPLSQWLHAGLSRAGFEVVLLETRQVKAALSAMVVKTDGVDGPRRHHRAKATAVTLSQGGHPHAD